MRGEAVELEMMPAWYDLDTRRAKCLLQVLDAVERALPLFRGIRCNLHDHAMFLISVSRQDRSDNRGRR